MKRNQQKPIGPQSLGRAIKDLIALRGIGQVHGQNQLASVWFAVAEQFLAAETVRAQTRVLGLKRGVLEIHVGNAPLLGELTAFHKPNLLAALNEKHADWNIQNIKFRLQSRLKGEPA